jgi:lambda repressor-like predicted transcriptional regulator
MQTIIAMHPEDVKAGLRKRFGTVANFERASSLPEKSVNDVLRGRPNARVLKAIQEALDTPIPLNPQSEVSACSEESDGAHRLNRAAG